MANTWFRTPISVSATVIEEMSSEDCLTFLTKTTTMGRVAFQSTRGQQLLPVNFLFRDGRIHMATSEASIVSELATGVSDVVFEIDYVDRMTQHGWSVVVRGETSAANQRTDDPSFRRPKPWAPGTRDVLIELTPHQISGRRIRNDVAFKADAEA